MPEINKRLDILYSLGQPSQVFNSSTPHARVQPELCLLINRQSILMSEGFPNDVAFLELQKTIEVRHISLRDRELNR